MPSNVVAASLWLYPPLWACRFDRSDRLRTADECTNQRRRKVHGTYQNPTLRVTHRLPEVERASLSLRPHWHPTTLAIEWRPNAQLPWLCPLVTVESLSNIPATSLQFWQTRRPEYREDRLLVVFDCIGVIRTGKPGYFVDKGCVVGHRA